MIQRIQTVYLLIASLLIFCLFLFPYVNFADLVGMGRTVKVSGIYSINAGQPVHEWGVTFVLQTILTIILGILPLYTIFLFKNRKKQLLFVWVTIVALIGLVIWMYTIASGQLATLQKFLDASSIGVGFFIVPIAIIFLGLAIGGIRRDQKLIKSVDRLRS